MSNNTAGEIVPFKQNTELAAPAPQERSSAAIIPSNNPLAPRSMEEIKEFARITTKSGLFTHVKGPEQAFVILATGMELGLSPMQSMRGIHVVEGKPILAADLIVALVKRSSECLYFRMVESDSERAIYETLRRGDPKPTTLQWTMEQARRADLAGRRTWKAHPAAMLRARCSSALARTVYPDLLLGVYDPDEAEDIKNGGELKTVPLPHAPRAETRGAQSQPVVTLDPEIEVMPPQEPPRAGPSEEDLAELEGAIFGAETAQELKSCADSLRALGLPKGHPARARLASKLSERAKALGIEPQEKAQPPREPPGAPPVVEDALAGEVAL